MIEKRSISSNEMKTIPMTSESLQMIECFDHIAVLQPMQMNQSLVLQSLAMNDIDASPMQMIETSHASNKTIETVATRLLQ